MPCSPTCTWAVRAWPWGAASAHMLTAPRTAALASLCIRLCGKGQAHGNPGRLHLAFEIAWLGFRVPEP